MDIELLNEHKTTERKQKTFYKDEALFLKFIQL